MSAEKNISVGIKADAAGFAPAMKEAANTVRSATENMRGAFKQAADGAAEASVAFAAFAAAAAIGNALRELVTHVVEMGTQFAKASEQTGMAASSLSQLSMVAAASDTSFQSVVKGLEMMDRNLLLVAHGTGPAAEAFKILGVTVTDANGHLKSNTTLLTELTRVFSELPDGPEKTALAMRVFGRAGAEMIPVLNQGTVAIAQLKADSDALGATMEGDLTDSTRQYHHAMVELKAAFTGLENEIGGVAIPAFLWLGQTIAKEVLGWQHGFLTISLKVQAMASTVAIAATAAGEALALVAKGKFKEAGAVIGEVAAKVRKEWADTALAIEDDAEITQRAIDAIMSKAAEPPKPTKPRHVVPPEDVAAEAALLASMKEKWQETEDGIRESSAKTFQDLTAQERAYWVTALQNETLGAKQKAEIRHHLVKLDLEEKKRGYAEEMADYKEQESALTGTAVQQATERITIVKQELASTLALYSENSSQVLSVQRQLAAAERTLRAAEAAEEKRLAAEQKKAKAAAAKEELRVLRANEQVWMNTARTIGLAFDTTFMGLMRGTQTFGQTFQHMTLGIVGDFVKMTTKMVAQWAVHEGMKTGILSASLAARLGLQTAAHAAGAVAKTASAVGQVTSDASVGAAGAAAAVAPIPFVGPTLAPQAAAATFALIMANMAGAVASAAGGYNIPAGVNPLTQLHAEEMVLPAELAEKVRGMSGGGGATVNLNVSAMDARSVEHFFRNNGAHIAAAIKEQHQRGNLSIGHGGFRR